MFLVAANTRQAIVGQKEWITTGSSGIQVQFLFSSDWDGLAKFAVFRNAEIEESAIPIALPASGLTELPAENCAAEYVDEKVYVGVYGTDGLGHIIIPTIWVSLGVLKEGAAYEGMDPPQPTQDMWAQILAIAQNAGAENAAAAEQSAEEAAEAAEAIQDMNVEAETLPEGSTAAVEKTVDTETGAVTLSFGIPRGNQGNPGTTPDFQIGTVETLPATSPATATITGTPAEPVLNLGIPQGPKGEPGGSGGTTDYRELENKPQINGHTLNENQSASDLGLGTYSKPDTGIPKTDLASDVQQSLGKADSALQSAPVSSVAGKTGAVTLAASDVSFDDSATYADGSVGAELSAQSNAISQKAPVIINTASGDIATFADGADGMPIKHLVANIEAVQEGSGDPSPSNVRPITGWTGLMGHACGKNLYDIRNQVVRSSNTYLGIKLPHNTNFVFSTDGTITGMYISYSDAEIMPDVSVNANWTAQVTLYNTTFISFTSGDHKWYRLMTYESGGVQERTYQLEVGSTPTDYDPYQGQTISVSWQPEAGTVYGGTLDVVTGLLTVNNAVADLGALDWVYASSSGRSLFTSRSLAGQYKNSGVNNITCNALFECYKNVAMSVSFVNGEAGLDGATSSRIVICDNRYTDAASFKSAMNGIKLCYELATPQTYQLDPVTVETLYGSNAIYVDCGSVTVDYPADTELAVEDMIAPKADKTQYVTLSGTIITQTGADNTMYLCGELAELTFTAPATGQTAIRFTSGTTPTVATFSGVTWLNGFDPSAIEASKTYEVNILNGLGCAAWT